MSEDNYTSGDPIFEHGGENEREFAVKTATAIDALLQEYLDDVARTARCAKQGSPFVEAFAVAFFRFARELERRGLEYD